MPNRLAASPSPYLRQHADNPVDWWSWSPEALAAARSADKPLLVSIGYSACHWCHVMAHESFEDSAVAEYMNEHFICIKVDREQHPDVDAICMEACQRMTGHGGWPLNVFLTPEQEPFFAGTYFPPEQRQGLVSWPMVLQAVAKAWSETPDAVHNQAAELTGAIVNTASAQLQPGPVDRDFRAAALDNLSQSFDSDHGGWGGAPKFPPHGTLEFLLAVGASDEGEDAREMALSTLSAMAAGGIYDQVGGGFHRYTVDGTWTVPHFEKMLYDNALLARSYLHGWQLSGEDRFREVCTETLDFILRELRAEDGGFCSALDADSEGVEGRFYVWTEQQLRTALGGELADAASAYFGTSLRGNFEGANVLEAHGPRPQRLAEIRCKLYGARAERVRPGLDDKRITAWNALAIGALAEAGAVLGRADYLEAASSAATLVLSSEQLMRTGDVPGYLDDYAYLVEALVLLYEASFEPRWYLAAVDTAEQMIKRFGDAENGGFFTTPDGQDAFVTRRKDLEDAPIPSGSSAAAFGLLRLARLAGSTDYERSAIGVLATHGPLAARHPHALGHLLTALDFHLADDVREVALVGPDTELVDTVRRRYRPHVVLAGSSEPSDTVPLLAHRELPGAYVCERFACQAPTSDPQSLETMLIS
ncbi:MAG: thioredoxin domain-containing protein [Solirubrobacterales bacterium]|nr:thioredoxin domain-containing protein [Solirubrobacterales bacterium]